MKRQALVLASLLLFALGSRAEAGGLQSLGKADEWLNSDGQQVERLEGKVVLVDFWTYTCVNWLRTLPYLRAWQDKYRDQGLVIVGVHSPEFEFERDIDNVRHAAQGLGVDAHGTDIDANGNGIVSEPRLYQLIRQSGRIDDRLLEIEFLDANVEAYSFTFG